MKKVLAMALALVMALSLVACGGKSNPAPEGGDKTIGGTYDITVWAPEAAVELTKKQINDFNSSNEDGITFNATVEPVSEADAGTNMVTDVEAGGDLYFFAQDQFARLVQAGALSQLGVAAGEAVAKAKSELDQTRPYFSALQGEIKRIFRTSAHVQSKYLYPEEGSATLNGTYGILVITADKGLAGAYNQNVIRQVQKMLADHADTKLFVVGEYGRQFFLQHHIPIERSFLYTAQNPTMQRAREISAILLDFFDRRQLDKIFIVYTDLKSGMAEEARQTRLLPFHRAQFASGPEEAKVSESFEFQPSMTAVLDNLMPSYVSGFLYSALLDSFCSEQNARMMAMDAASTNADELISRLSVEYNHERQGSITREITEMSSGVRAIRRKQEQ